MDELRALRERIDSADDELLAAFEKRMRVAKEIGVLKEELGLPAADGGRERAVVARIKARCAPDVACYVPIVWRALFAVSRDFQRRRP